MEQRTRKLRRMHKALHSRDDVAFMCQEKKEDEDLPASKITSTYRDDDLKSI